MSVNNYWWCWDTEATALFEELSPETWAACRHNAVALLQQPGGRQAGNAGANNGDILLSVATSSLGVALLPSFIVGDDLRSGRLERVMPAWRVAEEPSVHAVYPAGRNLSPKVRVFIDFLAARFGETPYWDEGIDP